MVSVLPSGTTTCLRGNLAFPDHARTLQLIADTEGEAFYRGELAEAIHRHAQETGGFSTKIWLPFSPNGLSLYRCGTTATTSGTTLNGQGLAALIALGILDAWEFHSKDAVETYHRQIEALKLAMTVGKRVITERGEMPVEPEMLLEPEYLARLRSRIGHVAQEPEAVIPEDHGTVYLAAADGDGNMISFIQSNYMGFGSGIVVPGTGIALQNRGAGFSLREGDANYLKPGKRSYHTIIPGFLTKDGRTIGPFGLMGGFMQPQGHLQVIMNAVDFQLNPQAALDAPHSGLRKTP